jgi:hypothetical protein
MLEIGRQPGNSITFSRNLSMCRTLVQALAHPSLTKFGNIIASEAIAPVDTISFWPGPTEQKIMLFQWDKLEKKNRVGRQESRCTHSSQKLRLWGVVFFSYRL